MKFLLIKNISFVSLLLLYLCLSNAVIASRKNNNADKAIEQRQMTKAENHCQSLERKSKASLSLLTAVCIAIKNHPSVMSVLSNYRSQAEMIDAAKSGYYPQVSLTMQGSHVSYKDRHSVSPKITAQQMVYDFGKVRSQVDFAKSEEAKQKANVLAQIDDLIKQTGNVFIELNRLQQVEEKTKLLIKSMTSIVNLASSRSVSGLATKSDTVQATSRLIASEATLLTVQTEIKNSRVRLKTLLGSSFQYSNLQPISEQLLNDAVFDLNVNPKNIPAIMIAKANQITAKSQIDGANAEMYPTISVVGSSEKTVYGNNPSTGLNKGSYNYIGLSVSQSLFTGGGRSARIRSAKQLLDSANFTIENALLDLNDQLQSLRELIEGSKQQLSVLALRKITINETRTLYEDQYTLGTRPLLDLLNAEQEVYQVELEQINAQYDLWKYYLNYAVASGNARQVFAVEAMINSQLGEQIW